MKIVVRPSANKDVKKLPKSVKESIEQIVLQTIAVNSLSDISNLKKLKGSSNAFRIKTGNYRIGIFIENDTIIISRILHRKDIYRYFP